jgi:zinc protease
VLDQLRTRLSQENENPDRVFSREVTKTVYGNPLFHPLEIQDLEDVRIEQAMEFIGRCRNPADYTLVFVGSLNETVMRPLAETYLASIPVQGDAFNEWADADYQRPENVQREIRMGMEQRCAVYMTWFTPMEVTDSAFAVSAALEGYLEIIMNDEIRESLGGVYAISTWATLSPLPRGELGGGVYFICNPGRAEELSAAAEAQIRLIAGGRIDADVLAKSLEALSQSHDQSIQSNLHIAQSYANSVVIYDSPLSRLDNRPRLYQAVSASDLQDMAKRLLENGPVRIILFPEGWN